MSVARGGGGGSYHMLVTSCRERAPVDANTCFFLSQKPDEYRSVVVLRSTMAENDKMWYNYLEDVAIRHFKALGSDESWANHHTYVIDLWEQLLANKKKEHHLIALHVLIHFRQQKIARIIQLLQPLGIMGDYVCKSTRYLGFFDQGNAQERAAMESLAILAQARPNEGARKFSSSLDQSFSPSRHEARPFSPPYGSFPASPTPLSPRMSSPVRSSPSSTMSSKSDVAGCSVTAAEMDAFFYCDLILAQLNQRLISTCDDFEEAGREGIALWARAIPGVVRPSHTIDSARVKQVKQLPKGT